MRETVRGSSEPSAGVYPHLAIFVISFATLACELLQNRIFSFQYWYHVVYFVVTTALLGMAAGGSIYHYSQKLQSYNLDDLLRRCLSGFAIFMIVSTLILSKIDIGVGEVTYDSIRSILRVFGAYSIIIVPYIFFGVSVSAAFQRLKAQSGKLYFNNLTGSAAGCVAFVVLLEPLGIEALFVLLTALCALMSVVGARKSADSVSSSSFRRFSDTVVFLVSAGAFLLWFNPSADQVKQFNRLVPESHRSVETTMWHPLARVDVISHRDDPDKKFIVYDGDAQTTMRPPDLPPILTGPANSNFNASREPLRDLPYLLFPERRSHRVAVIGSGGGQDVAVALRWGADLVDAIEINSGTNYLVTGPYNTFLNGLFKRNDVRLHTEDGRTFIARNKGPYDRIVLYGTDSFAASAAGAYVFSEAYLYTREAMVAFIEALEPNGLITFGRWYYHQKDREAIRVFSTALDVLATMGVADPARHLLVVGTEWRAADFAFVMISRSPIAAKEVDKTRSYAKEIGYRLLFAPEDGAYVGADEYRELAQSYKTGTEMEFYKNYPYRIEPVSDDSPFFFQYTRLSDWFQPAEQKNAYFAHIRSNPNAMLFIILAQTVALVVLIVFGPAYLLKRRTGFQMRPNWSLVVYFVAIGLAFMFVEISLIQRMVLYLGSPVYSFAVVVPAILGFAGIGSYLSGFVRRASSILFPAIAVIALWAIAWHVLAEGVNDLLLNAEPATRLAFAILLIAPLGVAMGVPFPIGIRCLCDSDQAVPILWAVNSGCSVIASILVIPLAQSFGFQLVMGLAVALYITGSATAILDRARRPETVAAK
jgi:spermidine synthase